MAVKLGDLLLQQGAITQAELEEALKYQVIFGGKLGTNLIEMGVLEEEDITRALSRKFRVPGVDVEALMNVPAEVIRLIPAELAKKYRVLPLTLENRRLTLAMADPADLRGIDEIAFRTGLVIWPQVAAEVRLVFALEKYYGIERERRYIHTAKKIEVRKKRPAAPPAATEPPPFGATRSRETSSAEQGEREALPTSAGISFSPQSGSAVEQEEVFDLGEAELVEEEAGWHDAEVVEAVGEEAVSEQMVEARDRNGILDAVLGNLATEYPRCAVFLVRGDLALGWKCAVERKVAPDFDQLEIPLDEPSVLKTVAEGKSYYLGPIARTPFNSMMLHDMGGTLPDVALLVPLLMMGRVVGILYVDGKGINLGERLFHLQKLTAKAAMAFEILVLKNKILSL